MLFRPFHSRRTRDHLPASIDNHPTLPDTRQQARAPSPSRSTTDNIEPTTPSTIYYYNLAQKLRPTFPPSCNWLEEGDLEFTGEHAVMGGRYAEVWKGQLDGRVIAIKKYRCYVRFDSDLIQMRFSREVHVYSLLSHLNIVPFVGVYNTTEHPFCLVFDSFMERLSLADYIQTKPNASKVQLVTGIARGLHHMHDLGVVHGNLERTNVLVDPDGTPRIAGLGSSFIQSSSPAAWSEGPTDLTRCSAPELVNPEAFGLCNSQTTKASDIFAFGVLAYEVFMGALMFPNKLDVTAIYSMSIGERPLRPHDPELSDEIWDMITRCWAHTPSQRITIAEAVSVLEAKLR